MLVLSCGDISAVKYKTFKSQFSSFDKLAFGSSDKTDFYRSLFQDCIDEYNVFMSAINNPDIISRINEKIVYRCAIRGLDENRILSFAKFVSEKQVEI